MQFLPFRIQQVSRLLGAGGELLAVGRPRGADITELGVAPALVHAISVEIANLQRHALSGDDSGFAFGMPGDRGDAPAEVKLAELLAACGFPVRDDAAFPAGAEN